MRQYFLKTTIPFKRLEEIGFIEDPANTGPHDAYFAHNNYYREIRNDVRVVVNMHDRAVRVLVLNKADGLLGFDDLSPIVDLVTHGFIET